VHAAQGRQSTTGASQGKGIFIIGYGLPWLLFLGSSSCCTSRELFQKHDVPKMPLAKKPRVHGGAAEIIDA